MKKSPVYKWFTIFFLSAIGSIIGYFAGNQANLIGWDMFWQVVGVTALGFLIALSMFERKNFALRGFAVGILVTILLNMVLNAKTGMGFMLMIIWITTYVGYCLHHKSRPIYVGGGIGGVLGFIFGLYGSYSIGELSFPPGFVASIFMAFTGILLGMFIGTGFSYSSGYKD